MSKNNSDKKTIVQQQLAKALRANLLKRKLQQKIRKSNEDKKI